jgi:hypothetical protein
MVSATTFPLPGMCQMSLVYSAMYDRLLPWCSVQVLVTLARANEMGLWLVSMENSRPSSCD